MLHVLQNNFQRLATTDGDLVDTWIFFAAWTFSMGRFVAMMLMQAAVLCCKVT
jgi:hypothetical protein